MSDLLVSPSRDTDWRFEPAEFVRALRERWAAAQVTTFEVRSVVPPDQELIVSDQGYSFDVPLTEGIEPAEIVEGVETT